MRAMLAGEICLLRIAHNPSPLLMPDAPTLRTLQTSDAIQMAAPIAYSLTAAPLSKTPMIRAQSMRLAMTANR